MNNPYKSALKNLNIAGKVAKTPPKIPLKTTPKKTKTTIKTMAVLVINDIDTFCECP